MKSINIKDVEISISLPIILNALSAKSYIEIDINGNIYVNEKAHISLPIIFKCESFDSNHNIMDAVTIAKQIFKEYRPVVQGTICRIKPLIAWQDVIDLNKDRMLYFDHQSDGVELFEDKQLEDMGWEATALDIPYRQITEHIEKSCEGFLIFYDNEIQFNGFVIASDINHVRSTVKSFIIEKINEKIEEGSLDSDDYDTQDALEFFGVKF